MRGVQTVAEEGVDGGAGAGILAEALGDKVSQAAGADLGHGWEVRRLARESLPEAGV